MTKSKYLILNPPCESYSTFSEYLMTKQDLIKRYKAKVVLGPNDQIYIESTTGDKCLDALAGLVQVWSDEYWGLRPRS